MKCVDSCHQVSGFPGGQLPTHEIIILLLVRSEKIKMGLKVTALSLLYFLGRRYSRKVS